MLLSMPAILHVRRKDRCNSIGGKYRLHWVYPGVGAASGTGSLGLSGAVIVGGLQGQEVYRTLFGLKYGVNGIVVVAVV